MTVHLIAAVADNGAIGKDNDLLWHLPDDMKYFKDKTSGTTVISGRRNYESIPEKYRPLPGRRNIVVTRNTAYEALGATVVHSLREALDEAGAHGVGEVYIIGGGQLYREALEADSVDVMHLTRVHATIDGDTHFPDWNRDQWTLALQRSHPKDDRHAYAFTFETYIRNH